MIKLSDSYVRHLGNWPNSDYLEGRGNNIEGFCLHGVYGVKLMNSFNEKTTIAGRAWHIGPVWFMCGKAMGYSKYPDGVRYVGLGVQFRGRLHTLLPKGLTHVLYVSLAVKGGNK